MNYERNYYSYVNYIKTLKREKDFNINYELHHIVPKSMGGSDKKENLVLLTFREHYLAHYLLWKIYNNKKMLYAFWLMNNPDKNRIKLKINSFLYKKIREEFLENQQKKVVCLETGEVYTSLLEAANKNGLKDGWSIRISINNKKRIAGGFHWDEYDENIDYTKNKFYGQEKEKKYIIRLEDCKKYLTYKEAGLDNKLAASTICDAVKGKSKTAGGFHWDEYDENIDYTKNKFYGQEKIINPSWKKVVCIETGKIYNSQQEAARDIGYKISGDIGRCCDGKLKSCGGFHWKRYEN